MQEAANLFSPLPPLTYQDFVPHDIKNRMKKENINEDHNARLQTKVHYLDVMYCIVQYFT